MNSFLKGFPRSSHFSTRWREICIKTWCECPSELQTFTACYSDSKNHQ